MCTTGSGMDYGASYAAGQGTSGIDPLFLASEKDDRGTIEGYEKVIIPGSFQSRDFNEGSDDYRTEQVWQPTQYKYKLAPVAPAPAAPPPAGNYAPAPPTTTPPPEAYSPPVTPGPGGDAPQRPVGAGTGDQPNKQPTPLTSRATSSSSSNSNRSRSLLEFLDDEEQRRLRQR